MTSAQSAGQVLKPMATPTSTTVTGIAKRSTPEHLVGIKAGIGEINTTMCHSCRWPDSEPASPLTN